MRLSRHSIAVLLALVFALALPHAGATTLAVEGRYIEDSSRALSTVDALHKLRADNGGLATDLNFNLDNRDSHFWLLFRVTNTADTPTTRLLDTGVPFRAGLIVYKVPPEAEPPGAEPWLDTLLETSEVAAFPDRPTPDITLHSLPFTLAPGATVELLLDYTTRGATLMPMALRTPEAFNRIEQERGQWAAFFYAASLVLLLVFLLLGIGMRNLYIVLYAGLFSVGLLFIAAVEGYGFKYLWPNAPGWNQYAGLFLLLLSSGLAFFLALFAMASGMLPRWCRRVIAALGVFTLLLAAACAQLPFTTLANLAGLLMLLAFVVQAITIASWLKQAFARHLVALTATLIMVPMTAVAMLLAFIDFELPTIVYTHGTRIGYFFSVTTTLAALATHITALKMDHDRSLQQALEAAQRDAELSRQVLEAEQRYTRARELAAARHRQLASTSHDIRQPLTSLRAVVDQLPADLGQQERDILVRSLDYIEDLSRNHVADTQDSGEPEEEPVPDEAESYRADLLLHTVRQMFQAEAEAKGIELRVAPCSTVVSEPPLVLMRILGNLTANAVKHCDTGRVLLGCRRRGDGVSYEVLDTGPGIPPGELERILRPYEKGDSSGGEGLGLAICRQLATEQGYSFSVASRPSVGTRFSLGLPGAAREHAA